MRPTPAQHNFEALHVLTIHDPAESPTIAAMGVYRTQAGAMREANDEAGGPLDWTMDIDTGVLTGVGTRFRTFSIPQCVVEP